MKKLDVERKQFNRWFILQRLGCRKNLSYVVARCDCGTIKIAGLYGITSGESKSCGCYSRERSAERLTSQNTKHNLSRSREYSIWTTIKQRCQNPRSSLFPWYGARGIKVCDRWLSFENFIADMGPRPSSLHTVDRIDNEGNYEPENCRWATMKEQAANRRLPCPYVRKSGVKCAQNRLCCS